MEFLQRRAEAHLVKNTSSLSCGWLPPTIQNVSYKPISEMDFSAPKTKRKKVILCRIIICINHFLLYSLTKQKEGIIIGQTWDSNLKLMMYKPSQPSLCMLSRESQV